MMTDEARAAWLDERRSYIGASEMAEAVNLSPWGDAASLWERKRGEAPEKKGSFRMELGTLVEPIIGRLASEALGAKLHRVTGPVRHRDHPYLASNPDFRIVGARGLVQAKFRLDGIEFGEPDDSGDGLSIPLHYRVQGWGELLTTGLDFVYFAVLDPRTGLSLHLLDRRAGDNEAAIEDLRLDLVEFWTKYVETGTMPPPSAHSGDALARRFPTRAGKVGRVASAEQEEQIAALAALQERIKSDTLKLDEAKNIVKAMIGEAAWIEGGGYRASWGETTRKNVAWKEIAGAYRSVITQMRDIAKLAGLSFGAPMLDEFDPDAIEGLYSNPETTRGPFTITKL